MDLVWWKQLGILLIIFAGMGVIGVCFWPTYPERKSDKMMSRKEMDASLDRLVRKTADLEKRVTELQGNPTPMAINGYQVQGQRLDDGEIVTGYLFVAKVGQRTEAFILQRYNWVMNMDTPNQPIYLNISGYKIDPKTVRRVSE